jgi:GNAT superfamily N-acetyltransferase
MIVRDLRPAEHEGAIRLLMTSFADDAGMLDVVRREDRLAGWFRSALPLLAPAPGRLVGAFEDNALCGVLVGGHTSGPGAGRQVSWLLRALASVGPGPAWRTIVHDQNRTRTFPPDGAQIVEFVATDPAQRGRGIGRALFEASHADGAPHWLETTRERNLPIFARLGYVETSRRVEHGVSYYAMQRPETRR